jgi:LytS/YehU family sensor histidine kinase
MMGVCIPIGYYFGNMVGIPVWGVIAAIVASLFERYEFGPIDDNILITVSSTVILFVGGYFGPIF